MFIRNPPSARKVACNVCQGFVSAATTSTLKVADTKPLLYQEKNVGALTAFSDKGLKPIEDESHVLIDCLLYSSVREKFNFHPQNITDLAGLLSNKNFDPNLLPQQEQSIQFSL